MPGVATAEGVGSRDGVALGAGTAGSGVGVGVGVVVGIAAGVGLGDGCCCGAGVGAELCAGLGCSCEFIGCDEKTGSHNTTKAASFQNAENGWGINHKVTSLAGFNNCSKRFPFN